MKITILTLFPQMFVGPFDSSIVKRAKEKHLVDINIVNIRNYGLGKHKIVDDTIYGGGHGMLLRVDILHKAISDQKIKSIDKNTEKVFLLSASGNTFTQDTAKKLSNLNHLILICGHYEGVDARIREYIDGEVSIGDFILTGGEIPAMLITDSVIRLIKGVLKEGVTENESFSYNFRDKKLKILEHPQYTKPKEYNKTSVPNVLLEGNHKKINEWKKTESIKITSIKRPDLLEKKA